MANLDRPRERHSTSIWSITTVRGRGRLVRALLPVGSVEVVGIAPRSRPLLPRSLPPTTAQVGGSVPPMDIDEFYEADPRRRASAELELGAEWLDADDVRHELNYVEDTGELYVLREPAPHVTEDPFGGLRVSTPPGYDKKMTVHVIAHIPTKDDVHRILDGWQQHMTTPDGAQWLGDRLRAAGVVEDAAAEAIADDGPDGPA